LLTEPAFAVIAVPVILGIKTCGVESP